MMEVAKWSDGVAESVSSVGACSIAITSTNQCHNLTERFDFSCTAR